MQNVKKWSDMLNKYGKTIYFNADENTKTFVDLITIKFRNLDNANDYIWLISDDLIRCSLNSEVIKFLLVLNQKHIISNLYLPIEIQIIGDSLETKFIEGHVIHLSQEMAIEALLKSNDLEELRKNFGRFRIIDWEGFVEYKKKIYTSLGILHGTENEKEIIPRLKFDENSGRIYLGQKFVKTRINSNEYVVCKVLFSAKPKEHVIIDDILAEIDTEETDTKKIYKAMVSVNNKIKNKLLIDAPMQKSGDYLWREETDIYKSS